MLSQVIIASSCKGLPLTLTLKTNIINEQIMPIFFFFTGFRYVIALCLKFYSSRTRLLTILNVVPRRTMNTNGETEN